jgi:hypothetical protein
MLVADASRAHQLNQIPLIFFLPLGFTIFGRLFSLIKDV